MAAASDIMVHSVLQDKMDTFVKGNLIWHFTEMCRYTMCISVCMELCERLAT